MKKATTTPPAGGPTTTEQGKVSDRCQFDHIPFAPCNDCDREGHCIVERSREANETVYQMMEQAGFVERLGLLEAMCHALALALLNPDASRSRIAHLGRFAEYIEAEVSDLTGAFETTFDFIPQQLAKAA